MGTTVDKRVVEMAFENSKFESNVGTSLSTIDRLKKALNFGQAGKSLDGLTDSARRVNLNPIAEGVSAISSRFSALGIVGIGVLLNLTNAALAAGQRIVNALVIDPIKTGLTEYETKLNSVQTILANTQKEGTNLQTVTDALNELNTYSDKTIYNFQQMARNIGTFTAAGVKLDTSVAAIKGIANLAAVSGSNADQASTAMYQLSQALSTGTVRLMDWNSVVNAGMGGQVFQDAIMETARVHGVAIDQIIEEEGSFRDSLQRGWFTSEILTETLQKFTGDLNEEQLRTMGYTEEQIAGIIKMGQTAQDAATKVKTFSQLMGTLAEAAQSGWAQTWEIIIGDFEEAKSFLTDLNNFFGGLIGASADARNTLLQGWSDLGGRTKLIEAFQNAINAVVGILNPLREGMREIFPPLTAQNLMAITEALANFTKRLILTPEAAEKVKRIFKGVFALLDIGKMAIFAIAKELGRLLGYLTPVGGGLTELIAKLGDFISFVRDSIKANDTFGKVMRSIGDFILMVVGSISIGIQALLKSVEKFRGLLKTEGLLKAFQESIKEFFGFFKNLDFSILTGFIDRIVARFAPLSKLGEFFKGASKNMDIASNPFVEKLSEIAGNIREAIGKFILNILDKLSKIDFSNFDFKSAFDNLNTGLLSVLLISITQFVRKGTGIFGSITDIFKGVTGFAENANGILASITTIMDGVRGTLQAWQQQIRAGVLMKIAGAIAILAASLIALSLVDSEKLTKALAAISALFVNLFGAIAIYEKTSNGVTGIPAIAKAIGAMIGLSVAVLLLSGALVMLSNIKTDDMVKGIGAIVALTGVLVLMSRTLATQSGTLARGSISLILFSVALRTMIGPIKTLGALDLASLTKGLVGLGVLLAEIGIFIKTMNFSANDLDDVLGLAILSGAISILTGVIKQLGQLDSDTLVQGMAAMGILLTGLAGFTKIAGIGTTFILTATGLLILSGAMVVMTDVLERLGKLSWEQMSIGLAGLGGSLLIMATALNAMSTGLAGAAALVVAAGALMLMVPPLVLLGNMSLEQVGIALLALAGAFTVLGLAGAILTPVVPTLLLLGVAIAAMAVGALAVGAALLGAGAAILFVAGAFAILAAIGTTGLATLAAALPILATGIALSIIAFAKVIKNGAPELFEAGKALMLGFIKSVSETSPQIVGMVLGFINDLLTQISEQVPSIVEAGYSIITGFLTGIRDNIGEVTTLVYDIMINFMTAVTAKLPEVALAGTNLIIAWLDAMTLAVEQNMPRIIESTNRLGNEIVKGVIKGLIASNTNAKQAMIELGQILIDAFKSFLGIASPSTVFMSLAAEIVRGLVLGILNTAETAATAAITLANRVVDSVRSKIGDMAAIGRDLVSGFANGIRGYISEAINAAQDLANSVMNTVTGIFDTNSPSRRMFEQGKFLDQGLAGGIDRFGGLVTKATENVGENTVAGFSSVVSRITDAINADMNLQPTLRPVMDLTDVEAGGTKIDSLLSNKRLNVGVVANRVASIGPVGPSAIPTSDTPATTETVAPAVSFVQNNYSPKELSRIDIYRQTKSQILQAQKLVGAK